MKHEKVDSFPYGITEDEVIKLMSSQDVYDVLETFDSLQDSLEFIKEIYGVKAYEYAQRDAEQNINEEKVFIEYEKNNGNSDYVGYASFDVCDNIENYRNGKRNEPSFFWFSTGKVARVVLY